MCAVRAHTKHLGRVGFAQPRRDPGTFAGTLQPSATPRPGRRLVAPSRAGRRGRGPPRRAGICRTKTGPALDRKGRRLPRLPGSTRAPKPSRGPKQHEPASRRVIGIPRFLPHQTRHPSPFYVIIFVRIVQAARVVILTLGRGLRGPTSEAGGAGERALQATL